MIEGVVGCAVEIFLGAEGEYETAALKSYVLDPDVSIGTKEEIVGTGT